MSKVKILDYVAKGADVIYYEEMENCGVALTQMDGLFIVSRKFKLLAQPEHERFLTFSEALGRYHYILKLVLSNL